MHQPKRTHLITIKILTFLILLSGISKVSCQDGKETILLRLQEAKQSGSFEFVGNSNVGPIAIGTQHARYISRLSWEIPADMMQGWYRVSFTGTAKFQPTAAEQREQEPYIVVVTHPDHPTIKEQRSFSFKVPGAKTIDLSGLPDPLLDPTPVTSWQSSQPLLFEGKTKVELEIRRPLLITGDLKLEQVPPKEQLHLTFESKAPFHMFTDSKPVGFGYKLHNLSDEPFKGEIRFILRDALDGTEEIKRVSMDIGAKSDVSDDLNWTPKFGAYRLTAETLNAEGDILYRQHRYLTYGPEINVRELPDSWPVAFHRHPNHPMMIPPIGAKWVRTWWGGSPSKVITDEGSYDWKYMDEHVEFARMHGHKLLSVTSGDPEVMQRFMQAFWKRYAPHGDDGVIGAVEIGNEPNAHPDEWPPERYAKLAKIIYEETKKMTNNVQVVGISMSGGLHLDYMEEALKAGLKENMDIASLHLYEIGNPVGNRSIERKTRLFKEKLEDYGLGHMPVWNTESGTGTGIRQDGVIIPQEELNRVISQHPDFDPSMPYRVGNNWRSSDELLGTAKVIRAAYQQLVMGVEKNFMYQWGGSPHHFWVYDYDPGGNPLPKIKVVAAAMMSKMLLDYGPSPDTEQPEVNGNDDWLAFAHRFEGPKGRMTIVYVHPTETDIGPGDHRAALATGDKDAKIENQNIKDVYLRSRQFDPVKVRVPVNTKEVIVVDMFGRTRETFKAKRGFVKIPATEIPQYILEIN